MSRLNNEVSLTHHRRSSDKPLSVLPGEPPNSLKNPTTASDITSETNTSETSSTPALPPAPTKRLPREETVNYVLDLTDQLSSTALFGPIGVGKSFVAHTLLDHERTQAKFGTNRHLMRCDDLTSSLNGFLERLSDVINVDRTASTTQLQSHLESSPPFILLLEGVDLILDPLAPEVEEISTTRDLRDDRGIGQLSTRLPGYNQQDESRDSRFPPSRSTNSFRRRRARHVLRPL